MSLGVVVFNYRGEDLILDCLASLAPECGGETGVRVVVDNSSGDSSSERIASAIGDRAWSAWAQLVESTVNGGFSAGNNLGLAAVAADFFVLLNSDTIVRPGALKALLAAAERQPGVGLVGPRLEDPDGTAQDSCFRYASPWSELMAAAATWIIAGALGRRAGACATSRPRMSSTCAGEARP